MDLNLKNLEFLYSLHGQVPGMLDWDFENEFVLPCTTDQCLLTEQNLLKHRFLATNPPQVPQKGKASLNKDDPHIEPNLWMWVNPNIVCPLGIQGFPNPSDKNGLRSMCPFPWPLTMDKESSCSEAAVVDCQPFFPSDHSPEVKHFTSSICELEFTEEKVKEREDNSSAALQFPNKE
nr:forkhead box protein R2 [Oryctolagus cuniculus]